ncbi:MAG: hypothetical protein ACKO2H_12375, partial [Bacteroidota bacterium]
MNQHNQSTNAFHSDMNENEQPIIVKLKNEILQLQQSLEIRMEENKYLRMQLNRLDKNRRIGDLPFVQNLRPETRERGSAYVFGLKETDFIPKHNNKTYY